MVTGIDFFHFHFSVHITVVNKINIGNFHLQEAQKHRQYETETVKTIDMMFPICKNTEQ